MQELFRRRLRGHEPRQRCLQDVVGDENAPANASGTQQAIRGRQSGAAESYAIIRRSARSMPKPQARPRTDAGTCPTAPCNSAVVACTFWHNLQPCTEQNTVHSQPARQRRPPASALRLLGLRHLQLGARLGQRCRVSGRHHRVQGYFARGRGLRESSCHGSGCFAERRRRVK